MKTQRDCRPPRGATMLEIMFVLTILAGAFIGVISAISFIARAMVSEQVHSDQYARASGTLYDLVSELRDATLYSPNFYVEQDPTRAPSITFDKVDTVDGTGKTVWGNKITYRLEPVVADGTYSMLNTGGISPGRIVREETPPDSTVPSISIIENNVPYQFIVNGVPTWGFNVSLNGCALSLTTSRFGDTHVALGDDSTPSTVNTGLLALTSTQPNSCSNGTSSASLGTVTVFSVRGTYFLRNPQEVIPAQ